MMESREVLITAERVIGIRAARYPDCESRDPFIGKKFREILGFGLLPTELAELPESKTTWDNSDLRFHILSLVAPKGILRRLAVVYTARYRLDDGRFDGSVATALSLATQNSYGEISDDELWSVWWTAGTSTPFAVYQKDEGTAAWDAVHGLAIRTADVEYPGVDQLDPRYRSTAKQVWELAYRELAQAIELFRAGR